MELQIDIPEKMAKLFLEDKVRYRIAYGGRGGAKSWSAIRCALIRALEKKTRFLCTREYMSSMKDSVHKLLSDTISTLGLDSYFDVTYNTIRCKPTGSEFIFSGLATSTVSSIKSLEGCDIVICEEADNISEKSWQLLIPTIRKDGSEIWVIFNPKLEEDPTYVKFVIEVDELKELGYKIEHVNYTDNPYCPKTLIEEANACRRKDMDLYNHIWMGLPKKISDSSIFKGKYVVDDFEVRPEWTRLQGLDFGYSVDPSAAVICYFDESNNELFVDRDICQVGVEITNLQWWLDGLDEGTARRYIMRADCSRPEIISHLKRNGWPKVNACRKWPGSVDDSYEYLRSFDKITVHTRCQATARELATASYKVDAHSREVLPDLGKFPDHCIDAIRYAIEPLILGQKKKIAARPDAIRVNSIGRQIPISRLQNPNMWIS